MKTTPDELDPDDPREDNIRANLGMLLSHLSDLFPGHRISIMVVRTPAIGRQSRVNLATDLEPKDVPFFLGEAVRIVEGATAQLAEKEQRK